ncbi:MAG: Ig-like domain-containing protein, partial [Candidatus Micrarchaeota archaeon]|nr:Ig-like domain-containing protein [Candidatus Micrarchaeota archaeon]
VVVNYYNYTNPGFLIFICKSGDSKTCYADKIRGNCTFTCNYFDPGNYTLSAITTYQRCFYSNITVSLIDTVNPAVTISNPKENQFVQGTVIVRAFAEDNDKVKYLQLYFDNTLLTTVANKEISYPFDTTSYSNGYHEITAVAFDRNNNRGFMKVRIYINN